MKLKSFCVELIPIKYVNILMFVLLHLEYAIILEGFDTHAADAYFQEED